MVPEGYVQAQSLGDERSETHCFRGSTRPRPCNLMGSPRTSTPPSPPPRPTTKCDRNVRTSRQVVRSKGQWSSGPVSKETGFLGVPHRPVDTQVRPVQCIFVPLLILFPKISGDQWTRTGTKLKVLRDQSVT